MTRLLAPLGVLCAAVAAVWLATDYVDNGLGPPEVVVGAAFALVIACWALGRALFKNHPYRAGLLLECGLLAPVLLSAVVGGVLLWWAIKKGPDKNATPREAAPYTALTGAITAYLAATLIKPDTPFTSPVVRAIAREFGSEFTARANAFEKDARDAVQEDEYGAQALPDHNGDRVDGWGWKARRLRTKHIQDQLDRRK